MAANRKIIIITQLKIAPKLVISKKDSNDDSDVKQNILLQIAQEKKAKVSRIINKGDSVVISCLTTESSEIVENCLRNNLDQYNIEIESTKNPVVRIIGINNITNMNRENLEQDINDRNFDNLNDKVKILHVTKKDTRGYISVICEVS